jgi:hypothetical protein
MRTTLAIDPDVLSAARELASRDGGTIGHVISDLARQSLTRDDRLDDESDSFYGFHPIHRSGSVVITNEMVNAIREAEGI